MTDAVSSEKWGWTRSSWTLAVVVGVASLVLRALALQGLLASDPLLRAPALDDAYYLEMAERMAAGVSEPWFLAPLHPWIAAKLSAVFELDVALLCWTNAVIGALTSASVALCARTLYAGRVGWFAGGFHALAGVFVFHDVLPGQEPLLALLHVLAAIAGIRLARGGGPATAAGLGALTGSAVLGRGTSLALLLCALPAMRGAGGGRRLRIAGACLAGLVIALLPAMIRNGSVHGSLSPLPWSGGANLYVANGPDARATVSFYAGELGNDPWAIESRSREIAVAASARDLTPSEVSAWWRGRTFDELGSARDVVTHQLRKLALFWSHEERGSNHAMDIESSFSVLGTFGVPFPGWLILPFALWFWWARRRDTPECDALAAPIAGTWLLLTVFFPVARYRYPAYALGVALWCRLPEGLARRRQIVGMLLATAAGVVAWLPIRDVDPGTAHVNVAAAHMRLGDGEEVVEDRLRRGIAAAPRSGPAHEMLGRLLLRRAYRQSDRSRGRQLGADAFGHLVKAAQDRRTRFSAQVAAIAAMVLTDRPRAATAAQGLLSEQPGHPELLANAAWVAWTAGDIVRARSLISNARRIAPDHEQIAVVARFTGL